MSVGVAVQTHHSRLGVGMTARDPLLFHGHVAAAASITQYADGSSWLVELRRRRRDVVDPWRADLLIGHSSREPREIGGDNFERDRANFAIGRLMNSREAPTNIYLLGGVESERAQLLSAPTAPIAGPATVDRSYLGPDLGIAIHAAKFEQLSWLLPAGALVDVPHGIEAEIIAGIGRDAAAGSAGARAAHVDG